MSKIITVINRKGGVGKSTSTLNLGCVLGELGHKVLIIDLDDQQNASGSLSKMSVKTTNTIEDLLLNDDVKLKNSVVKTEWANVSLVPSSSSLSGVVKYLDGEVGGHLVLGEKLLDCFVADAPRNDDEANASCNDVFDYILIDTSPSLNILVINALCASDYIFIPLSSKYFSMQGLAQTLESFKKISKRLNPIDRSTIYKMVDVLLQKKEHK